MEYVVEWKIEVEADSPRAAAEEALRIQMDRNSIATIFKVTEKDAIETIDVEG